MHSPLESLLKIMNSAFYFILKAFFVVKTFKFLFMSFLVVWENALIRKLGLISKFI